jgi:phosphate-selective porin OprO/OprP
MNNTPTGLIAAKRLAVAVAAVCATLAAPAFADDDVKVLLDLMLKKGVITQQDYDQFMKDNADKAENKEFKNKRLDSDVTKSVTFMQKRATDGAVRENGLGLTSADGQHTINLTGRVHFDARAINSNFAEGDTLDKDSGTLSNNFEVRRARIGINGKLFKDFGYELVTNAVGSNANLIDTAFITYGFNPKAQVRVGRFKQGFSLEELTSSNNIDFMERSYVNQFIPGKQLGAMLFGVPSIGTTYSASVFQSGFNNNTSEGGGEGALRLTGNFAEIAGNKDMVMHVGFAGTAGSFDAIPTTSSSGGTSTDYNLVSMRSEARGMANIFRIRQAGEATTTDGFSAPSPSGTKVNKNLYGVEFVAAWDALKVQGEMAQVKLDAISYQGVSLKGSVDSSYIQVVYNITGEKWADSYKDGSFGALKIKNNFDYSGSGTGAWQVGLRFSQYDGTNLYDATASGKRTGSEKGNTTTVGLTWFLNPNARIMLNYSQTIFDRAFQAVDVNTGATDDQEKVIALRTQINF